MEVLTTWLKPIKSIGGRDPLGVRMPGEIIYADLVPGITNVTDRARYYSFYPWLVWAIKQQYPPLNPDEFVRIVRRADCLFTFIAIEHQETLGRSGRHLTGLIGSQSLPKKYRERTGTNIQLSAFTQLEESPFRYFKNRLGGLGQYYLGPLRDLGILSGDFKTGSTISEAGEKIALAFDQGVPRDEFFAAVEADTVTVETLQQLKAFCPCHLTANAAEQQATLDLLFNREGIFYQQENHSRRATLVLMLDLVAKAERTVRGDESLASYFRACTYTGALPDGEAWDVTDSLAATRDGWSLYQRNELLSIAIQGIFHAAIEELWELEVLENRAAFCQQFYSAFADEIFPNDPQVRFSAAVEKVKELLPDLKDWQNEKHEIQLGRKLLQLGSKETTHESRVEIVRLALETLLALAARNKTASLLNHYFIDEAAIRAYPINLFTFCESADGLWRDKTLQELLRWLVTEWGLDAHLRVALRKLRLEGLDTFRIKPLDSGLHLIANEQPAYTTPRLAQVCQMLFDVGALAFPTSAHGITLTPLGQSLLEECRD